MAAFLLVVPPADAAKAPAPTVMAQTPLTRVRTLQDAPVSVLTPPVDAKCPEWWPLSIYAGFDTDEARTVDVILWRESRCDIHAPTWNRDDPNGGSRCAMQVNGSWTGWLKRKPNTPIDTVEDLFKPAVCMWAARQIFEYSVATHGYEHRFSAWRM